MRPAALAPRVAYGVLFGIALPVGLLLWAAAATPLIPLPPIHSPAAGFGLAAAGGMLILAGAYELMRRGRGLPMNPFPPPILVESGVYRWLRNPMYLGFGLAVAGVAIASGSIAGLWLVTPVTAMGTLALVFGYERQDLRKRFGIRAARRPLLSLPGPDAGDAKPRGTERAAVFVWVLGPWLLAWFALQALGRPPDAFSTSLPFERSWPVVQSTELLYLSAYLFVPLTPLCCKGALGLRQFAIRGAIATAIIGLLWLLIPVVAEPRPFLPSGFPGDLLRFEQQHSRGVAAFPAFHVVWPMLAALAWEDNARISGRRAWRILGWTWALLIIASTITTSMHTVADGAAGLLVFLPVWKYEATWRWLRGGTERLAASWKEWRLGPVRIINHGVFAGAGAGIGFLVVAAAIGPGYETAILAIGVGILVGAALAAQLLEGSPRLLRPFGWYGGLTGGIVGAVVAGRPAHTFELMAGLALAAPWIQLLGRLRCLIQGCCHGAEAPASVGIRYSHPRTRPVVIGNLTGLPLYPTQLWSIAGNLVVAAVLIRLWTLRTPAPLVVGTYLILAGAARFVEEAYRGEAQTPIWGGLRIYQWLAAGSVLAGMLCTTLGAGEWRPAGFTFPTPAAWAGAALLAVLFWFAMGMDFPNSNRRFSRLAPAD